MWILIKKKIQYNIYIKIKFSQFREKKNWEWIEQK